MSDDQASAFMESNIFNAENAAEMVRLINLDRLATRGMGGTLVGLPNPAHFERILLPLISAPFGMAKKCCNASLH